MANRDAPNGFAPVGMLGGGMPVPVRKFPLLSTHVRCGIGDVMEVLDGGTVDVDDDASTTPQKIVGVCVAIYDSNGVRIGAPNSSVATKYITASAGGFVDVALAVAGAVFRAQSAGSVTEVDRFSGADHNNTTCDTTTGLSVMELAEGAQGNFLIIDKVDEPGNAWGTNVQLLVIPGESYFVPVRAGV